MICFQNLRGNRTAPVQVEGREHPLGVHVSSCRARLCPTPSQTLATQPPVKGLPYWREPEVTRTVVGFTAFRTRLCGARLEELIVIHDLIELSLITLPPPKIGPTDFKGEDTKAQRIQVPCEKLARGKLELACVTA